VKDLQTHKAEFEKKFEALSQELKGYWNEWDKAIDDSSEERQKNVRDKMVDLLNRRSYIRNLVRDVNEALES
jgi:molecular chaperone HscB